MRSLRPGSLIVGCCLLAVGLLGLLDAQDAIDVGAGALLAVLLIGLGLAGFARAVWGGGSGADRSAMD
ncbi:MAG: hypothetical protein ACR2N6_05320 [Miltoncostaeaceae bacterium]